MTKNRVLYLIVIILSCLFIYFYDGRVVFITLYAVLLLPFASFLITFLSIRSLTITQHVDKDYIVKAEEAVYTLSIRNRSLIAYSGIRFNFAEDAFAVGSGTESVLLALGPRSHETVAFPIFCKYRGVYEIGLHDIELQDFLGLFRLHRMIKEKVQVTVYPKVVEITGFPLSMNLMSKAQSSYAIKEDDFATVSDVRKYSPEDSYKKIHWKLTAKKNDLMVKNYQSTARNATAVILDSTKHTYGNEQRVILEDKIIEGLVAVLHYCLKRQFPVDFLYGNDQQQEAAGIADFEDLYAIAAKMTFMGQKPVAQRIEEYLNEQVNFTNIIILTSNMNDLLFERVINAFYFGHYVALLYFSGNSEARIDDYLSQLRQAGIICYKLNMDDPISEILGT